MEPNPLKASGSSGSLSNLHSNKPQVTQHHQSSGGGGGGGGRPANNPGGLHHSQLVVAVSNDSKFYLMSSIELKDPLETQLEDAFNKLQNLINPSQPQTDSALFNALSQYGNQSKVHYDELCGALLYSILTDPAISSRSLRNLFLCNNLSGSIYPSGMGAAAAAAAAAIDPSAQTAPLGQYAVLISNLSNITSENYHRLKDQPRQQLVWLLRELVKARVNQCDKLLLLMLRNIQSGNLSDKNVWLAESMLDILSEQINNLNIESGGPSSSAAAAAAQPSHSSLWIYTFNNSELMLMAVYTFLRLIADHSYSNNLNQLRQRETEFCVQILREKWNECMSIGRDLVRLLQNVAKLPEFELLWRDIIYNPQALSPQFGQQQPSALVYLMRLPTKKRCIISRLTLDMERKIYFLITSVKNGQQKRYQEWFQRQYLNTPESQSLRVDLIRYILAVVHPTNEQLNAGLTPRWALCSWLLSTCTNPIDSANLKLALFYDWLLYDPKKDNIMLIEPGILLMYNSLRANMPLSNTSMLFDFLCRIAVNYHLSHKEQFLIGIQQAFKDSVDKRVIPSMQVFFDPPPSPNPKLPMQQPPVTLDKELRNLIQQTFGNFFQTLVINQTLPPSLASSSTPQIASQSPSAANQQVQQQQQKPQSPITPMGMSTAIMGLGSASSLFRRAGSHSPVDELKTEPIESSSSLQQASAASPLHTFQTKLTEISSNLSEAAHAQHQLLKTSCNEMKVEQIEDSNSQTFSSDEEDNGGAGEAVVDNENDELIIRNVNNQVDNNENTNLSTKSGLLAPTNLGGIVVANQSLLQFLFDFPTTTSSNSSSSSSSASPTPPMLNLEQKMKSFLKKPFKIFTTMEEQTVPLTYSQANSQASANLENHLSTLQSNELRNKLADLNEKLNNSSTASSSLSFHGVEVINLFKEIMTLIYQNEDELAVPDIAACLCIILKNEFNNNLLKMNTSAAAWAQPTAASFNKSASNNNQKSAVKEEKKNSKSANNQTNREVTVRRLDFSRYDIYSLINNKLFVNYVNDLFISGTSNNRYLLFNCLFKELIKTKNQSPQRELLIHLMNEIYLKQNRLGYFFLFYICSLCLINMKLEWNDDSVGSKRKKLRQFTDITRQTISRAFMKNEKLKQALAIYNEFINEYLKSTNSLGGGVAKTTATQSSSNKTTAVTAGAPKNHQISTYDSDSSESADEEDEEAEDDEDEDEEDDEETSDSANDDDDSSDDENNRDSYEEDEDEDENSDEDDIDDEDDSEMDQSDDDDKQDSSKNEHDESYSDEDSAAADSNNQQQQDSSNRQTAAAAENESNNDESANENDLEEIENTYVNEEFDLYSVCSNELNYVNNESIGKFLMQDLRLCQQDDPYLFIYLLPFITNRSFLKSQTLCSYMLNNAELVYLIVSCIDAKQLRDLLTNVANKNLILFRTTKIQRSKLKKSPTQTAAAAALASKKKQGATKQQKTAAAAAKKTMSTKRKKKSNKSSSISGSGKNKRPTSSDSKSSPNKFGGGGSDSRNKKRKRKTPSKKAAEKSKKQRTSTGKQPTSAEKKSSSLKKSASAAATGKKQLSSSATNINNNKARQCQCQVDETFIKLLSFSLEWESIEQSYFWQLINAQKSLIKLTNTLAHYSSSSSSTNNQRTTNNSNQNNNNNNNNKGSKLNESSLIRLNVNNINNKIFINFFNKLNSVRHSEALIGVTNIFKINKPNIQMVNALFKRPIIDFNLIESIFSCWLDREQEMLIDASSTKDLYHSSLKLNQKHNLAYLVTKLTIKSAILFDKFSIRLKRQISSSIKANTNSSALLSKLEDGFDEIDEYDLVNLKDILYKLNRLVLIRSFRTKRFLRNHMLLLALRSVFVKCFNKSGDIEQVSDDDEEEQQQEYEYNGDNDLVNYKVSGDDEDDEDAYAFDDFNDSDNEGGGGTAADSSSAVMDSFRNQFGSSVSSSLDQKQQQHQHRRMVSLKLAKHTNLKKFVDQELKKQEESMTNLDQTNNNKRSSSSSSSLSSWMKYSNFKLDDELESFLVKTTDSNEENEDDDDDEYENGEMNRGGSSGSNKK